MNRQFAALSGAAMLLIVLNHTIEMGIRVPLGYGYPPVAGATEALLGILKALGIFAVPAFLFISGTFAAYAARGNPPRLTPRFVAGAVAHILWPYIFWSFLFYAVVLVQFGERYSPAGYAKNLLTGYPFHFIPMLVLFYLVSPLMLRIGRRFGSVLIALVASYQLFLLGVLHTEWVPQSLHVLFPPVVGRTLAVWAVYFPLGLLYGIHMRKLLPLLKRWKALLGLAAALLFALGVVHRAPEVRQLVAGFWSPVACVLLLPAIERRSIPRAGLLERIGKRSYGLYLTHLLVLDLVLWGIGAALTGLLAYRLLLLPFLFLTALLVPLAGMEALARSPMRAIQRYILG